MHAAPHEKSASRAFRYEHTGTRKRSARGTTLLERAHLPFQAGCAANRRKKTSPQMKICRDENDSRGTTLLGRANASRPAWIPLTGDQFGKCTPAASGLSTPAPRALPAEKFRPKALSAYGAFSLDARKTRFRQDPIQRLSNRIELLDGIIPHIFRLSSGKFRELSKREIKSSASGCCHHHSARITL